jgi:hypothetical protein
MVEHWADIEQRFPHECRTEHRHEDVVPWLKENVGEFDDQWYRYGSDIAYGIVAGMPLYDYYRFRDEQAAVLFNLKWS